MSRVDKCWRKLRSAGGNSGVLERTQECWSELRIPGGRVSSGEDDLGEDDFYDSWRNASGLRLDEVFLLPVYAFVHSGVFVDLV